jgi:membrane protein DedA with SNARE-associated domain
VIKRHRLDWLIWLVALGWAAITVIEVIPYGDLPTIVLLLYLLLTIVLMVIRLFVWRREESG